MDSAFQLALGSRLQRLEGEAERNWWGAMNEAGLTDTQAARIIQSVGRKLTWALWDLAIDEAGTLARR